MKLMTEKQEDAKIFKKMPGVVNSFFINGLVVIQNEQDTLNVLGNILDYCSNNNIVPRFLLNNDVLTNSGDLQGNMLTSLTISNDCNMSSNTEIKKYTFMEMLDMIDKGNKMKLPEWEGFWYKDIDTDTAEWIIGVFTKEGTYYYTPHIFKFKDRNDWIVA